ncbi:efflux RND transporter permease subunit [Nodularia spumigena]|uniref:efflux RND transporter permease subunit n=3 Tax=Nodularia spumigena TaxID=70799 RepID=UPI00232E01E8|nr:efflux RND transporter permease subunit [Nodularia spumigena]MDB9349745.1 efflux RND transporter permease subunit [Nodularia spumigena CS-588/01]MDB9351928.1 efflux RND transporter permease subunit [Nodularia spumigena CS-588/05]MDB9357062.1 efflux RND transporter permease subunit [Nodularia spumigena CS-587/03]MDB9498329.1 efflux RND transporter permease subunit [Nodularia spumigena CS-336/02]
MFIDFFIKRPVFSTVCAFIVLLLGLICLPTLPIARFPDIAPTQINVTANFSGASAEDVETGVTNILERQINGIEGIRYITSSSSNDGSTNITATFDSSRNADIAAVDVQNRVSVAQPQLPEAVQRTGVRVTKQSNNILLAIGLFAENDEYDNIFLSNYADLYIADALKRVKGVGNVRIFGERRYAMRLWLDPNSLSSRGLTMADVANALVEQNLQVGAGSIGQEPAPEGQRYQIDVRAASRLTEPSEFEEIVLKTNDDGTLIKLKDVGRAELGAENYNSFLRYRAKDAVGLGIYQLPGSNALDVARGVREEMARLAPNFPPGLRYEVAFDTTRFVEESMSEVVKTLIAAIILVVIVIFVFLQDWRTTLIPAVTVPLSLIGTFIFARLFGFSINSLTLFGLTLASGMVVDDAIVVVEQISRFIKDKRMSPRRAASESMAELFGAVIATSLVLMAVFIPVAFFPGTTGALYRQFALTIAFSIVISTFLALTLTPSLCALLLRPGQQTTGWLGRVFERVNQVLDSVQRSYERSLNFLVRFKNIIIGLFIVSLGMTAWLYITVPTAFLPEEDEGFFITLLQGPQGVSLQYTSDVMAQVEKEILQIPEVVGTFAVGGFSFSGNTANNGIIFTTLKPWGDRSRPDQTVQAIIGNLRGKLFAIPEARIFPVNPPPIQGLGNFGGFNFQLQDRRGSSGLESLVQSMGQMLGRANQTPGLQAVFSTFAAQTPQLLVEVDRNKAKALQVSIDDIFRTLQTALGSQYVNDFNLQQRNYRVYIQADQQFRSNPKDIGQLYVRSQTNQMIPLKNLITTTSVIGAQTINHYNLFRSIEINGSAAPGSSSGKAIQAMEQLAAEILPPGFGYEWSGTALEEIESGGLAPIIFGLGIVFVFLVLAAQYENYIDPLIILLAVPLAIFGALVAQSMRGFSNDVYCQIGLVMLIGLASKNAILIVEFANQLRNEGLSITKAAVEAAQERLRPILMTAFSTLLGIFPLTIATGAGAGSRQSLGTTVFGGMLIATFLSLFVVPILYIVIKTTTESLFKPNRHQMQLDDE